MLNRFFLSNIKDYKKIRMYRWFASTYLYHIGLALVSNDYVQHFFYFLYRTMPAVMRAAHSITGWASKVTPVGNFQNCQATVLLMILAKAAIIRATKMCFGVKL